MTVTVATSATGFARPNFARHAALLAGVSIAALLVVAPGVHAKPLGGASQAPSAAAIAAAQSGSQEAARAARNAGNSLKRATQAIQAMQASQQAARDAARVALGNSGIPNGLGVGGLQAAPQTNPANLWQGANLPTQFTDGDRTRVDIQQTRQKAILTWDTFHVGGKTDVNFKQDGSNWVALNRVLGTDGKPSQILGNINARGQVYVINQNGIVFGGASQVNVGALIASTARISDDQFLDRGIYSTGSGSDWTPSFTDAAALRGLREGAGTIDVKAGARIETHAPASVTAGGGFVLLMGGEVHNAGSITTLLGQTQLAAGDDFVLRRGYGTDANTSSTTRGNEIAPLFHEGSASGAVANDGMIFSPQGDITFAGRTIAQNGSLVASTSVNTRGTIHLLNSATDTSGSITLGENSVTTIIPELESEETALNSQRDGLIAASDEANRLRAQAEFGVFDNLSLLADRLDQSRIEIVTGGEVIFRGGVTPEAGSLTIAQGGQVSVSAGRRIFTESGSIIDVSGMRDVSLAMSNNNLLVNIQGNELRDSPVNRDQNYLKNQDVWVDIRDLIFVPAGTGGYDSDRYYTPGGLLEVGGYLANTTHTIGEWSALGGTITLAAPEVIAQAGTLFDVSGGSVRYEGGTIRTTNFLGRDGRLYNINNARGDMTFYGLGHGFIRESKRWGVTQVWSSPFGRGRESVRWEEGYTVGRDAGSLILSTPTAIFEGDILADVVQGTRQFNARPDDVTDGYKIGQNQAAKAGQLLVGAYGALGRTGVHDSEIVIGGIADITEGLNASSIVPSGRTGTLYLDATRLNRQKLGGIDLATNKTIEINADLTLADGGILDLVAPVIDIRSNVTARSGSVSASNLVTVKELASGVVQTVTHQLLLSGASSIKVGQLDRQVTLDMRGHWANQSPDGGAGVAGLAWLDGGSVKLIGTGDVTLAAGSLIDVSSGGAMLINAKTRGGTGGSISLRAGEPFNGSAGTLTLDGDVRGYGINGGGTLNLQTGGSWVIGGKVLQTDGKLAAGEVAVIDLILDQTLQLQIGQITPIDLVLQKTRFDVGTRLDRDIKWPAIFGGDYTVPGGIRIGSRGWTLPPGMRVVADGINYWGNSADVSSRTVPASATITQIGADSSIPIGYFIDPLVLPDGLPVMAYDYLLTAGSVIPTDAAAESLTLNPGHRLSAGAVFSQTLAVRTPDKLALDTRDAFGNTLLERGFSRYDINATRGLAVVGDTVLAPRVPTLRLTAQARVSANGDTGRQQALVLALDPVFREDPRSSEFTQRPGADLALRSGMSWSGGLLADADLGSLYMGPKTRISVDPGRDVRLESYGQLTIEGRIEAPAGEIAILNPRAHRDLGPGALSIWIGEQAVLDAAGRAYTARDLRGRRYGVVHDGGSIVLGSRGGEITETGERPSSDAFIIVRPGAVLDVSGASADLDDSLFASAPGMSRPSGINRVVASHGGEIAFRSYNGIYLDGTLRGAAGGEQASGGSLTVELESPIYKTFDNPNVVPNYLLAGRVLTIGQNAPSNSLANGLRAGQSSPALVVGRADLGASRIEGGGFASATLLGRDRIAFDGDVTLTLDLALTLSQGMLVNTREGAHVMLAAPYVKLDGRTSFVPERYDLYPDLLADAASGDVLRIDAGLIDIRNRVGADFANLTLSSKSDLRFLANADIIADRPTQLANTGNLTLLAGQIYPASRVSAKIYAGASLNVQGGTLSDDWGVTRVAQSSITIGRSEGAQISPLYSVFGDIAFSARHIAQGGVVRAPLGAIVLEGQGQLASEFYHQPTLVELLPGSVTSVSAAGLVIPYGGTIDGVRYTVDGTGPDNDAPTFNVITGELNGEASSQSVIRGVTLKSGNIVSHENSIVDVSGGGKLAGAAFISGRGGSVDALLYPRQQGGEVYAVVPGTVTAPVAGSYYDGWKGNVPGIGQQVTVPEGVAGLPAGSYMLLPANYALLPGAFRVELGEPVQRFDQRASAVPDGSYMFRGATGIAGTGIRDSLARSVMLTPGSVLRSWSQYNETSYADFQLARAALNNVARPMLERDGRFLSLALTGMASSHLTGVETDENPALVFDGRAKFDAAKDGYAGALGLLLDSIIGGELIISGPGGPTTRIAGNTVDLGITPIAASTLNAIGAPTLYIGALPTFQGAFQGGSVVNVGGGGTAFSAITLTSGAVLRGGQILVTTSANGRIKLHAGAGLSTVGWASSAPDSSLGYQFQNAGLVVSSGRIDLAPLATGSNSIKLDADAFLYAEGTLGFSANGAIDIDQATRLGARYLGLSSSSFNIGTEQTLQAARQAGVLSAGMILTQDFMNRLLQGDPASGVPAAQSLTLTASNSLNFLGTVSLSTYDPLSDASLLDELVVNTPAIYGLGAANDVASVHTDTLVWRGNFTSVRNEAIEETHTSLPPGAVIPGGAGTGIGTLDVRSRQVVLGWPKVAQAHREVDLNRLALGFSTVNFEASERIVSNNRGNLSIYQSGLSPDATYNPLTYAGVGGNLNLVTPLLTGASGSDVTYRTGGILNVRAPAGGAINSDRQGELGAIVNLVADQINLATAVLLPSGRLTLKAQNDVTLLDGARLDFSGRRIDFFDTARYSAGGEVVVESARGNILMAAGSSIDVSAVNNDAGRLQFTATDTAAGRVKLNGALHGAGGAGDDGGFIDVRAQLIGDSAATLTGDFAALNGRLNDAGFLGERGFALKQGSLSIGNELRAREIDVSIDGGSLVVNGRIDASGLRPGSIRLAARDDLTLASSGMLDAHGTQLQVDSYGQAIEAKNRGKIELTSSQGWLRLNGGSTIDVSSADGQARGKIELNVGRVTETGGDIRIDARDPVNIRGAVSVAVNAFWSYSPTDADGTVVQDNGGTPPVAADGSVGLNQIDVRNQLFMTAALANGDLGNRLAGLAGSAFHLRPGVEINSSGTPGGNLTVKSDLDLSGYRYGPAADRSPLSPTYGAGEPLALVIRAGKDLKIRESISDGFGTPILAMPPEYTDLIPNIEADGRFVSDLPWWWSGDPVYISSNLYQNVYLTADWTVPDTQFYREGSSSGAVTDAATYQTYAPGDLIPAGTMLLASWGSLMLDPTAPLPNLALGLNPAIHAQPGIAPMAAGNLSASIRLVAGADLSAADSRMLQSASQLGVSGGDLLLAGAGAVDIPTSPSKGGKLRVVRTGAGDLELLSGRDLSMKEVYGVYTAGTPVEPAAGVAIRPGTYLSDHGGDLRFAVQGSLTGLVVEKLGVNNSQNNFGVGNWLVRTGSYQTGERATWSINYGNEYAQQWYGFGGIGTLGGGNVFVQVGRDAGVTNGIVEGSNKLMLSTGLVFAIGSSGYVVGGDWNPTTGALVGGEMKQFGGGDLSVRIGGRLNPDAGSTDGPRIGDDRNGSFTNTRGNIELTAAAIGSVLLDYGRNALNDPRAVDAYRTSMLRHGGQLGGPVLVLGDSRAKLHALGDLVLGGVGDAGQTLSPASSGERSGKNANWFSLWSENTAVELFSAGGNVAPLHLSRAMTPNEYWVSDGYGSYHVVLPARFAAVSASGSLYFGYDGNDPANFGREVVYNIDLAPSQSGVLSLLAKNSIHGAAVPAALSLTGGPAVTFRVIGIDANPGTIPNPFKPATFSTSPLGFRNFYSFEDGVGAAPRDGAEPIRLYAVDGDITNLLLNERLTTFEGTPIDWMVAAAQPVRVQAGGDIVNFGTGTKFGGFSPSLIVNGSPSDVSIISAGRDILFANVFIGGPGTLEVSAGRNIYQGDKGSIVSVGPLATNDTRPGASILMQAGVGVNGPDYTALVAYLDPANLAVAGVPLADQPGKVAKTYEQELRDWLAERYGHQVASNGDALADFALLAPEQQNIFLRTLYFAELREGGREYNNPASTRFQSYIRGRQAIAALFPKEDAEGNPTAYAGDITMFGGSGVRAQFGGDIQLLAPGGQIVVGVEGLVPPASAGVMTQFGGGIQMFADRSILLGQSRIMTNYGDDIFAWSATGDINAGRGAKTTVGYTPPRREQDDYGHLSLVPSVPQAGAGISARSAIPGVQPGDIDLHAPLGTIDVGEAGIRGRNINISALHIVNAANISAQGNVTGVPTIQAPNIGGLTEASNTAGAAAQQAVTPTQGSGAEQASIIIVEVLGFGGGSEDPSDEEERRRRGRQSSNNYSSDGMVRVLGNGTFTAEDTKQLTAEESNTLTSQVVAPSAP